MKIRNGFVSNSSSSSFIIAIKSSDDVCPHCGRKPINIQSFLDDERDYIYGINNRCKGTQTILDYYDDEYSDNTWLQKYKKKMLSLEKKGYIIHHFSLKYHSPFLDIINSDPDIKIIYKSGE